MSEREMTASWTEWQGMVVDGTFYLDRYLGGTGRSAVYFTDWGEDNKPAAIKLIAADADAESQLSRWKLASELKHPNLLRIYQAGRCELDGLRLLYIVMEYADENLAEILRERPLSVDETREMTSGVLEALAALHHKGLVHGQLKPSNIVAVGDQLKVSTDSIARAGSRTVCQSANQAPETAAEPLSPSADIWSLGVTLVEALTQQRPESIRADGEPELPAVLPAPFGKIVQHCLLADPQRRWTVAGIRAQLSQGQTSQAERETRPVSTEPDLVAPPAKIADAKMAGPTVIEMPLPDWVTEDDNPPGLMEIFRPYVPVTLAAMALLTVAAAVVTRIDSRPAHGRGTASAATARVQQSGSKATPVPQAATPQTTATHQAELNLTGLSSPSAAAASSRSSWVEAFSPQTTAKPEAMSTSLSGALMPGSAIERPLPEVSLRARRTIHGRVKVKVKIAVDPSGSVQSATLDSRGPSRYFAGIAMETARRWRFSPAQINGQNVASEWLLKFEFRRRRTDVQTTPLTAADRPL
jgi:TonB family protein